LLRSSSATGRSLVQSETVLPSGLPEDCRFGARATAKIKTETIGDWLRLASQLKTVEIDTWKFEPSAGNAFYCEPAAENIDAHAEHYTIHATALTRFMFVCSGLEEAYRGGFRLIRFAQFRRTAKWVVQVVAITRASLEANRNVALSYSVAVDGSSDAE
jgi:hypothetical protein